MVPMRKVIISIDHFQNLVNHILKRIGIRAQIEFKRTGNPNVQKKQIAGRTATRVQVGLDDIFPEEETIGAEANRQFKAYLNRSRFDLDGVTYNGQK
jgi:hypothetical protein